VRASPSGGGGQGFEPAKMPPRFCGESRELAAALSGLMESTLQPRMPGASSRCMEPKKKNKQKNLFVIVLVGGVIPITAIPGSELVWQNWQNSQESRGCSLLGCNTAKVCSRAETLS
jgi:hypothetical protein